MIWPRGLPFDKIDGSHFLDKIIQRVTNKDLCIKLLCDAGFHKSMDEKKLIFDSLTKHSQLKQLYNDLTSSQQAKSQIWPKDNNDYKGNNNDINKMKMS